jgi:lipoprotein signal peptidase
MENKKILKWVGIFCILASAINLGVSLGLGKGLSTVSFGALAMGLILIALSMQSKEKK